MRALGAQLRRNAIYVFLGKLLLQLVDFGLVRLEDAQLDGYTIHAPLFRLPVKIIDSARVKLGCTVIQSKKRDFGAA